MAESRAPLAPIIDSNVHLWDQHENPVFWLSDRTLLRGLLGNYDSLPDSYTLADYRRETHGYDVRGIVWSDAGAADPVAAATWVQRQNEEHGIVTAMVTLGDPTSAEFADLVDRWRRIPLVRSVRVRLVQALSADGSREGSPLDDPLTMRNLALLARHDLVATIEATSPQLEMVGRIARELPDLRLVIDHFGWPTDLSEAGLRQHTARLAELAAEPNVATRIDAIGTIFGEWTVADIRPHLVAAVNAFGPGRCMLGSDLPIERLRSDFGHLYRTYGEIFADRSDAERDMLFSSTAQRWYTTA